MKTERRHELETNTLALKLGRWIDAVKPYSRPIGGLLVALLVVGSVAYLLSRQSQQTEASAWDAYYVATEGGRADPNELRAVASSYSGTTAEPWARLAWADAQLQIGSRMLFHDKSEAHRFLNQAVEAYEQLKASDTDETIRQRATFGLARAYESLGRLEEARQQYGEVTGGLGEMARQRAEVLEQKQNQTFYDWFEQAKLPRPEMPSGPGIPGSKPDFSLEGLQEPPNLPALKETEPSADSATQGAAANDDSSAPGQGQKETTPPPADTAVGQ